MDFFQSTEIDFFIDMNVTIMKYILMYKAFQLVGYCRHKQFQASNSHEFSMIYLPQQMY